jgi:hypothetical protein
MLSCDQRSQLLIVLDKLKFILENRHTFADSSEHTDRQAMMSISESLLTADSSGARFQWTVMLLC